MNIFAVLLLFPIALTVGANTSRSEMGSDAARALERIVVEGIPECLNTGESAKMLIRVTDGFDPFEFSLSTEHAESSGGEVGALHITPRRWNSREGSATVLLRGKKYGRERLIIRAVDRPDIAPVTAYIRIMPALEEAVDLNQSWTGKYVRVVDKAGRERIGRESLFTWRHKESVVYYNFFLPEGEGYDEGPYFRISGNEDSFAVGLLPEDDFLWLLGGKAVDCDGEGWLGTSYTRLRDD